MMIITKKYKFCAAHRYNNVDWSDKKNAKVFGDDWKIHGHNYFLEISLKWWNSMKMHKNPPFY